jgi:ATP-binding cassette subfamily C protein
VLSLAGNAPLPLDSAGSVWLVEAGRVEVFAATGGAAGARTHLASAAAGQALFGCAAADGGRPVLLAVGLPGTRLRRLDAADLAALLSDPGFAADLAGRLDGWLVRLAAGVAPVAAPKVFAELRPGAETHLDAAGRIARTREGVAWSRHLAGTTHLLGEESLALTDGVPFPVPEGAWLVSAGEARLASEATEALLAAGGDALWQGLALFHRHCLSLAALAAEGSERRRRDRLDRKAELDRGTLRAAFARLATVLAPPAEARRDLGGSPDPLLAACRLAGAVQGIAFPAPPETEAGAAAGDPLSGICALARVRCRRVILRDDWWRRDGGPLVAYRRLGPEGGEQRPVALLPVSPRRYEMVDPVEGTRTRVDAAVAEGLSGEAHMLYPPLPERPLARRDLVRMALGGRRKDLLTVVAMGVCGGLLGMLLPILTGQVFGSAIPGANRGQLLQVTLALVVAALAAASFQVTRSVAVLRLGGKVDGALQTALWSRLLSLPVGFFRRYTVGDLASRAMGADTIREMMTGNVLTSVLAAVFSVFSFGLLFHYSGRLALAAVGLVVVLAAVVGGLLAVQLRHQREILRQQGKVASLVLGLIGGIGKIRVAGAEARAYARWAEGFSEQRRRTLGAQRVAIAQSSFNAVYGVATTLALFAMVGLADREAMPVGEFLAFNAAFGQFLAAALAMVGVVSSVLSIVPVYERLQPILAEVPESDESKAEPGELSGEIEFSHVAFRYQEGGTLILDDVSFRAEPGEFVALVGPSGAGKSTCLRLILGFEKPTAGSIYFDGQDLAALAVQSVRRQIGVVLQNGKPMTGSLFSNIVGASNLGIDDAWEAARMAGLEDDIKAMPMGMHTIVSEGAETFSGGQKQRLLIARAIVHRPRIVLFDEATSALDNRTQAVVSESLERLKATRIVIAHRLSTVERADRIYVMEAGRVVEIGTFEELMRRGGVFARLAERQVV